jgi:beta-lactamase class A
MNALRRLSQYFVGRTYTGAFLLGGVSFLTVWHTWNTFAPCSFRYDLLNPTLRCTNTTQQNEWHYEEIRNAVLQKKQQLTQEGKITEMSVYFRDLKHGPRFGIGEYDAFQPASLLKLPVLIAFLHEADRDPSLLDKTLSYDSILKVNMNVEQARETILPFTPYTIRDLLRKMIVYSDNYSYTVLTQELNRTPPITAYHTFLDLDILPMMVTPRADFVSIQSYSNLFVVLYNSAYLSKQMSSFALQLLSEASFESGLVAGVPPGTTVAHKFGYRVLDPKHSQLHDCGIVYHPNASYLLCVMTSGSLLGDEEHAIREVSRVVYEQVSALRLDSAIHH